VDDDDNEGKARIVVVSGGAVDTLGDCLDGLAAVLRRDADADVDVVVVCLEPDDGAANVAIHHALPNTVVVVPPGDADRVIDVGSSDLGARPLVVLPADRKPVEGWLDAALAGLDDAWVVVGADGDAGHIAVDARRAQHLSLLAGVESTVDLERRVRAAGGRMARAPRMRTVPAGRSSVDAVEVGLPPSQRSPAHRRRFDGVISVVLCTRNRPAHVARCLASLARLEDPCHEILVIDNNDEPSVPAADLPPAGRVVHEPRRGLDVARNRGMQEARGEVIAYIDDDCEADPGWLDALRVAFADPDVDAVTGRVRPASLGEAPQRWFETQFSFDRGTRPRRFTQWDRRPWYPLWTGGVGTGCNMAFRRRALDRVGGFDEILDMGTTIPGAGDLDVFARLLDHGAVIEYTPLALVWHHHRSTMVDARRQFWGYGISVGALLTKAVIERRRWRFAAVRFFVDRLVQSTRAIRRAVPGRHPVPVWLLILDLAGQWVGVASYLRARRRATAVR
jgi:GT2 family glycosyltransferase